MLMSCCDDPNTRKEKPFPIMVGWIAALVLVAGGLFLLLGGL